MKLGWRRGKSYLPEIGVSMTFTLKYFIHQIFILYFWKWIFVFFAIFGLGKVLWFSLTKVSGKNQSYTYLYWFCKNLQIGTKSGEKKTKLARYPKDQKFQEITKIAELKISILSVKHGILMLMCKNLNCTDCTLLNCILHVYVILCTNRAFGRVKRYLTSSGT